MAGGAGNFPPAQGLLPAAKSRIRSPGNSLPLPPALKRKNNSLFLISYVILSEAKDLFFAEQRDSSSQAPQNDKTGENSSVRSGRDLFRRADLADFTIRPVMSLCNHGGVKRTTDRRNEARPLRGSVKLKISFPAARIKKSQPTSSSAP